MLKITLFLNLITSACLSYAFGQTENTYKTSSGKPCILCPPGYYFKKDCVMPNTIAVCKPCPPNKFTKYYNRAIHCRKCRPHCESDVLVTVQNCNATMNMECDCPPGETLENPSDKYHAKCKALKGCGPGWGVIQQGLTGQDPVCGMCRPGFTFSPEVSWNETCFQCTRCPHDDFVQRCNVTHDSICNAPQHSWYKNAALASFPMYVFLISLIILLLLLVLRRRQSTSKKSDEEDGFLSSKASSESSLTKNSEQIEMELPRSTNLRTIFQSVSRQIKSNWEEVIQSLFQAVGVESYDEIKATIQRIKHDNSTEEEQIYQCLLKWEQRIESYSPEEVLIQVLTEKSYPDVVKNLTRTADQT